MLIYLCKQTRYYMRLCCLLFFSLCVSYASSQSNEKYIEDYLTKWDNTEKYLLDVIKAMPAEMIEYSPSDGNKSFRDISIHIVSNMVWLSTEYLGSSGFETDYKNKDINKEELILLIENACKYAREALKKYPAESLAEEREFFSGPMNTFQILRLMNDHLTHHRAQLIIYLKLNGIDAPKYVGW